MEQPNGLGQEYGTNDPFLTTPSRNKHSHPHRFSSFDTQLFALNHPSSSPSQAKRALEAHLAETERRLEEASKLGTALVQQRKDLSDRLGEVELQQDEGEIGPELRQKLKDIEKEYNEVGRESARAGLGPKSRVASSEESVSSLSSGDGRIPASPSTFFSQANHSPSKLNVPSRKQRNQPSSRVHDIEFATEISTSLLSNVRHLQTLLAERDETLKTANLEKSRLEIEAEGDLQRLRSLDESEQRYKDENWSLETQSHELLAAVREASDREQRLSQSLSSAISEKSAAQRELDELKQANGKLIEDHVAARKNHESELSSLRRNVTLGDSERGALQRKVEELNSQNQELAKAAAGRLRDEDIEPPREWGSDSEDFKAAQITPEHSPPPSPTKGTPRHTMLESETLKSSLHHAHRMIQNLKSNIHREKSEKVELKRMLQEARDELELRRGEPGGASSGSKRPKSKSQQDQFKKPARPSRLGGGRNGKTDVLIDETGWEDHSAGDSPGQVAASRSLGIGKEVGQGRGTDVSDAYQTANETEDAFDTANERDTATENEAFQTGAETLAGDSSDELTETEGDIGSGRGIREKRPSPLAVSRPGDRTSFISTASDSTDEGESRVRTPVQAQPQRYRLKINRGAASRRSRVGSEAFSVSYPSSTKNSPASFVGSTGQGGQSLFAELGELNGGESDEEPDGTPSRVNEFSRTSTPGVQPAVAARSIAEADYLSFAKLSMVDSAMMTEPWEPTPVMQSSVSNYAGEAVAGSHNVTREPLLTNLTDTGKRQFPENIFVTPTTPATRDVGTQRTPQRGENRDEDHNSLASSAPQIEWGQAAESSDAKAPNLGPEVGLGPVPVLSTNTDLKDSTESAPERPTLSLSSLESQHIEPRSDLTPAGLPSVPPSQALPSSVPLGFSFIQSLEITPVEPSPTLSFPEAFRAPAATVVPMNNDAEEYIGTNRFSVPEPPTPGPLGSVLGSTKAKTSAQPHIAEDETSQGVDDLPRVSAGGTNMPFKNISANVTQRELSIKENPPVVSKLSSITNTDQGSQTVLSSEQIENILNNKGRMGNVPSSSVVSLADAHGSQMIPPALRRKSPESPTNSVRRARTSMADPGYAKDDPTIAKSFKRPSSSGSIRGDSDSHPPLPPDHRQAIAAAAQKAPSSEGPLGVMGPPIAPASAYKINRPRTPNEQQSLQSTGSKGGTTPRPRVSTSRSQLSHRSSFSSFASELDERFNIRTDGMPLPTGLQGGTDPRMIQAITQTMIGEYLWKYTRKAGRGEMSDSRHRRFFWVHPYTRTLYWSDRDPATAGRAEQKAKSVAIEAVRVVTDDNPMPPGLHRKSLLVITPGRALKFTATTGQRHETWFNALSYLLLRTTLETQASYGDVDNAQNITSEDVHEFNPSYGRTPGNGNARISMSSYNSRTTNNTSPRRNLSSLSRSRPPPAPSAQSSTNNRVQKHQSSQGSISRLSHIFKPGNTLRGSFSSRLSRQSHPEPETIYDARAAHDSAEDLRQVIEKQEKDADRLENVRACCDGKHDVGSLAKNGRHSSHNSRYSHIHTQDH
ncbi:MAG: hypothetical protein M1830_010755, partial [Pleopsidium flavum]